MAELGRADARLLHGRRRQRARGGPPGADARRDVAGAATLRRAGVELDALVGSGEDLGEQYQPGDLEPPPRLVVSTAGPLGGWTQPGGPFRAAPLPGPVSDAYGAATASPPG